MTIDIGLQTLPTVMSYVDSIHHQLNCLFNSLFRLITKKTSALLAPCEGTYVDIIFIKTLCPITC